MAKKKYLLSVVSKEKAEEMLELIIDIRATMEHDYIEKEGTIENTRPELFRDTLKLEDIIANIAGDE